VGQLLPFSLIEAARAEARRKGYARIELSWILEDNAPMRRICEHLGYRPRLTWLHLTGPLLREEWKRERRDSIT
jgi:hypothetical protein